jgi:hypothetical protein
MISRRTSSVPKENVVAPRLLYSNSRCSKTSQQHSQSCHRRFQVLPGAPESHCVGPVYTEIWPPRDSGPTTLTQFQRPPVTYLHFADEGYQTSVRVGTEPNAVVRVGNCHATLTGWPVLGCYQDRTSTLRVLAMVNLGLDSVSPIQPLWLWFSITVLMVSWHDQYVHCAVSSALANPTIMFATRSMFITSLVNNTIFSVNFACFATEQILVGSQIWPQEVEECVRMHNRYIDYILIRSDLRYLIGNQYLNLKCQVSGHKTGPCQRVQVVCLKSPVAMVLFWVAPESEHTWKFGPVANTSFFCLLLWSSTYAHSHTVRPPGHMPPGRVVCCPE